jgi:hypothetical protein
MPDGFVPLAEALRAQPAVPAQALPVAPLADACASDALAAGAELLEELRLARLAALEAYDRAVPRLLTALAQAVVGRELVLAPPDLAALAAELRAHFLRDEPVALVIAPSQAPPACSLPVRRDPALRPGDLILEVRDGEVDARFRIRLAGAIARALAP